MVGCKLYGLFNLLDLISIVDLTDVTESQLQIPQHNILDFGGKLMEINLVETVGLLTRYSFDERYRDPIISLGGVQALAELLLVSCNQIHQDQSVSIESFSSANVNFTIT